MSHRRRLLCLALSVSLAGCSQVTNPATGRTEFTAMSPEQEVKTGRAEHPKVLAQFGGAYDDRTLQAYVTRIGERLKVVSELPDLKFTFTLLNSDVVNAFALPGGYVYLSRGLLALAENEAEMAGVMAHEIGHVAARHSAQRYTRGALAQGGLALGTILAGVFGGRAAAEAAQQLGGAGAQAYLAGYSRDQEFQADELGVRYLARAGYDPKAMASFLEKLGRNDQLARKLAGKAGQPDPATSWFATHPRTPERVARAAEQAGSGDGEIEQAAYLDAIDGLIYGEDPSQGFIQGRRFVHPTLRFAFEASPGYRLANTPSAVLGRGADGSALKFDADQPQTKGGIKDYLLQDWARQLKASSLRNVQVGEVNGLPVASAATLGKLADGSTVAVALAALQAAPDRVYRFMFLHPGQLTEQAARTDRAMVQSFARLSAAEAAAIRAHRIKIQAVQPGQTAEQLASRMAVEDLKLDQFLVLNGLEAGAKLAPGERVKLIVN